MYPYFWPENPKANFLRNRANVSFGRTEVYGTDLGFWPKNPKANFLKNRVNVSFAKAEVYETDLDFSLKNPKANFKVEADLSLRERRSLRVSFLESSNRGPNKTYFKHKTLLSRYKTIK
jgi:hypothetical protein